jgi:hypothetical protein
MQRCPFVGTISVSVVLLLAGCSPSTGGGATGPSSDGGGGPERVGSTNRFPEPEQDSYVTQRAATALVLVATADAQDDRLPSAPAGQTWKLVWQDEFEGDRLDTTKWTPRPAGKRKGGSWSQETVGLDSKGTISVGPNTLTTACTRLD